MPIEPKDLYSQAFQSQRHASDFRAKILEGWLAMYTAFAGLAELLGSMTDAQLLARAARVFPVPATAIDISTVAECVEIIPAAPAPAGVTKTQTPVPTVPQAKPLSDAARDQAYFLYTTGTIEGARK